MIRRTAALLAIAVVPACASGSGHGAAPTASASAHTVQRVVPAAPNTPAGFVASARTYLRLPVGVSRTVVVTAGSELLVLGGLAPGDSTTARVWRVDLTTKRATSARPLAHAVHDASGATLGGRAFVFGGGSATTVADVQQWTAGRVVVAGRLPQPRSDSAAAVVNGTAYVVGGFSGKGMTRDVLATTDGRTFRAVGRLAIGVRYPAVAAVGGAVYVAGGALATTEGTASGAQTAAVQRFDPSTGKVTIVGSLPAPLAHAMAFEHNGALYVAGGHRRDGATDTIVRFDVRTGKRTLVGRLPQPLSDAGVVEIGGRVFLVGGESRAGPGAPTNAVVRLLFA